MKSKLYMSIAVASILTLTGCGGGGGSSSSSSISTKSIEGTAYDPEIVGADVTLVCGSNKYYATSRTNDSGYFKIDKIPSSQDLKTCVLESTGGMDAAEDFKNLTLKAPVSMFDLSSNDKIYITPLTTMVANDDDSASDISKALDDVAAFLGNKDKKLLNKKPSGEMAKIAKKLTLIAMAEKDGKKIGFKALDIDNISKDDINPENTSLISDANTKAELKEIFTSIDSIDNNNTQMALEIKKLSVKRSVKKLLRSAYNLPKNDAKYDEYKANINSFSEKITQALKDGDKYIIPNRYIIRKALSDADLSISLKTDGSLEDSIYTKITEDNSTFKSKIDNVSFAIKNVKGVTLYDVKKDTKVLGDDNNKRIEYYTFSNISHLGNAIEIAKTSYDDRVLDSVYRRVALGYIKLGFYDEAIEITNKNIYSRIVKIKTLTEMASQLIDLKKSQLAIKSLDDAYADFRAHADVIGESNLKPEEMTLIVDILVNFNKLKEQDKSNKIVTYMNSKILKADTLPSLFNTISFSINELIEKAILERRKDDFKYLVNLGADFALKTTIKVQDGNYAYSTRSITNILPYTVHAGITAKGDALIQHGKTIPKFETDQADLILAHNILKDKKIMNDVVTNIKNYEGSKSYNKYTRIKNILKNALAVALVLDGQTAKALELISKAFVDNSRPDVFKFFVNASRIESSNILGIIDTSKQEEFIQALLDDSVYKESPKDIWKFKDDRKTIEGLFINSDGDEMGYSAMIKYFAQNGSYSKIAKVIEVAQGYIDNKIDRNVYDAQATLNILESLKKIDYTNKIPNDIKQAKLRSDLLSFAKDIDLTKTTSTYTFEKFDSRWAVGVAKQLVDLKEEKLAKDLLEKVKSRASYLVPKDGLSLYKTKTFKTFYMGGLNVGNEVDSMPKSLLGGYIKTRQFDKAETLIDNVKLQLDKLTKDSLDQNELFIEVARSYGAINKKQKALDVVNEIETIREKNNARSFAIKYLSNFDAFPDTNVASIDTDGDGNPDFFNKFASQDDIKKSGLVLDEDIDGDNTNDDTDKYPYDKTKN